MLTPQEVSERAFTKASFGGYNMAQVDDFLDEITEDYTALYKENAALKSKMKVLVDKVEEYRSTEDGMRKALLAAQKLADDMVQEAEAKKAQVLGNAEIEAKKRMEEIRRELDGEQLRLFAAQKATADYVAQVQTLHQQAQAYLDGLSAVTPAAPAAPAADAADEIEAAVERAVAQEMPDEEPEDDLPVEDDDTAPTRRIDFDHLQFGKDYELK